MTQRCAISEAAERRDAGITMIEVIVVLVILSAVTAIVSPNFRSANISESVDKLAATIASNLRQARSQAIRKGRTQLFGYNAKSRTFLIGGKTKVLAHNVLITVRFTAPRRFRDDDGGHHIAFFHDGASSGGRIIVRKNTSWTEISVDWLTGAVEVNANVG